MKNIRTEKFADSFYPKDPAQLLSQIKALNAQSESAQEKPEEAILTLLPHAGYVYSARVALATLKQVKLKRKLIILCPNHTGLGLDLALWAQGAWQSPLGNVQVDEELASQILSQEKLYSNSKEAHYNEHSIEVLLPMLITYFQDLNFSIVPICVSGQKLDEAAALLAQIYQKRGGDFDIIISSDLNHYADQEQTILKDYQALEAFFSLNSKIFLETIEKYQISMCGVYASVLALNFLKYLGGQYQTKLVMHASSADITQDYTKAVGYAGLYVQKIA